MKRERRPRSGPGGSERKDALIQVWVKRTTLASVHNYVVAQGVRPHSISHLVRLVLEGVEAANPEYQCPGVEMASLVLDTAYGQNLNPSGRGLKNLQVNLQREVLANESVGAGVGVPGTGHGPSGIPDFDQAVKEELKKLQERIKQKKGENNE